MKQIRRSKKREAIIKLFNKKHILNAKEIVNALQSQMDRATIYRNLNFLLEQGTLRELKLDRGFSSFELNSEHLHQHFKCENCQEIYPLEINEVQLKKLITQQNFVPRHIELNISGKCHLCKSAKYSA